MKKVLALLSVLGLLAGSALAQAPEKKVTFNLNAGVVSGTGWGVVFFSLGLGADIAAGKHWTFSPEVQLITYNFNFQAIVLAPALLLNYSPDGKFFVGAGPGLPILVAGSESATGLLCAAANIGYRARHILISAYIATAIKAMFEESLYGARIGYRF